MGKAEEKLEKIKEEKQKIAEISKKIAPDTKESPKQENAEVKKEAAKPEPAIQENKKKPSVKKEREKKKSFYEQKRFFTNFIKLAGIDTDFDVIHKKIITLTVIPIALATVFLLINFFIKKTFLTDALSLLFSLWVFGSAAIYLIFWSSLFVYIDFSIYKRRKEIEAVFPDFLQLTAANINAGMPIDRALWFAIRPRFGILANEMEAVAKSTMVGENLSKALIDFSNKYDSITIKRALNLLLEGLESGGEIGDLLTRVANNIQETEILKKEMAASVTTYVIFILFATLGAAPFLFGLTTELVVIMTSIIGQISTGEGGSSFGGIGGGLLSSSGNTISVTDYQIFAITSICISTFFASIITSIIQKGDAKEAFKKFPIYALFGVVLYFIAFKLLDLMLGGFFK